MGLVGMALEGTTEKSFGLIKDRIPKEDKILLFVQFPDLMDKVAKILTGSGVKFFKIADAPKPIGGWRVSFVISRSFRPCA
jgi:hypothetical protein